MRILLRAFVLLAASRSGRGFNSVRSVCRTEQQTPSLILGGGEEGFSVETASSAQSSLHSIIAVSRPRGSFALSMAKKGGGGTAKKKTKKKKPSVTGGGGGGTGVKGFGGGVSTTVSSSGGTGESAQVDRSRDALAFYDWMERSGGGSNLKRVALGHFPLGGDDGDAIRGVVALRPIQKGEAIIDVPYEMALNLGRESSDPTLPAVNLLQEYCRWASGRGTGSRDDNDDASGKRRPPGRGPYFAMLPDYDGKDCLGSTDFFSDEALDALQSPLVKEETLQRRKNTALRFERDVEPFVQGIDTDLYRWLDGKAVTERHLRWAVWLVTSRVLTVQGAEGTGESYRLMIPFVDMCNHDRASPHVLTGRAVPGGSLKVLAGRNVDAGEQINICYGGGVAGNDRFIQDYGFLDSFDRGEAYDIVAKVLLGKQRISEAAGTSRLAGGGLRNADRERALEALRQSSLEDDEALLTGGGIGDDGVRSALEFRIGVKRALQKYIVI